MALRPDQQKVHTMLTEAIMMLCRNGLEYSKEFTVEGLLGITLDKRDVFLVNIKESMQSGKLSTSSSAGEQEKTSAAEYVSPIYHQREQQAAGNPFDGFPHGVSPSDVHEEHSPSGIMSCPLTPMMQQFKSPFRRMRGRRKFFFGMGRGMGGDGFGRGMRRKFIQHQQRMMHAMMEAHHPHHPVEDHMHGLYDQDGGMPFAKRHHLSTEMNPSMAGSPSIVIPEVSPERLSNRDSVDNTGPKVKVEQVIPAGSSDTERELTIDESTSLRYGEDRNVGEFGGSSPSAEGSPWYGRLDTSPAPSSVDTNDTKSDIFEDVPSGVEPALLQRIKTAILKEDGFFVTTRMLCRRYSAYFKSQVVIEAMKQLTLPVQNPAHIGVFKTLKEARFSKIFYKCPPERISPEQLRSCSINMKQYQQSYYSMPKPKGVQAVNWETFVRNILDASPYGTMNPEDFSNFHASNVVHVEEETPETTDTMAEFELQQFIVHGEGCFTSTRILCRRLSKQYNKVEKVIRAMKAMTRKRGHKHYVGEFVKVSERTKIFFKSPPRLLGTESLALYGITMDQYVRLYYTTPRPWDGSIGNWDTYIENLVAAYPYPFSDLPLDSCEVSPDVADRIRSLHSADIRITQTSSTTGAATAFSMSSASVSDIREVSRHGNSSLDRIRSMLGQGRDPAFSGQLVQLIEDATEVDEKQESSIDDKHYRQLRTLLGQGPATFLGPSEMKMEHVDPESASEINSHVIQQGAVTFPGQIEEDDDNASDHGKEKNPGTK